jgi:hypothetical protein
MKGAFMGEGETAMTHTGRRKIVRAMSISLLAALLFPSLSIERGD